LHLQYKPPAIYILELDDIYFLYFVRAFYISHVSNIRRRFSAPAVSVCLMRSSMPLSLKVFQSGLDPAATDEDPQIIQ
jgi:hypothetical protein